MAEFAVKVERLRAIEPHPNADRLDLAVVGEYRSIILKGQYEVGDLVAYIPEAGVLPDTLIEEMGLTGRLAGKQANRVKAIRLRGIVSQGLCYRAREGWVEGQDVTDEMGIIKYEPPIPAHGSGTLVDPREIHRPGTPANRLVTACERWLAVTGTPETQIQTYAEPAIAPTTPTRPIQMPAFARDLLDSVGLGSNGV